MKRLLSFFVALSLLCSVAIAEIITIDLSTATEAELQTARDAIDARITEIRSTNITKTTEKPLILSGNGTKILDGFDINSDLFRFVATCEQDTKVTWYLKGDNDPKTYGLYGESQSCYAHYFEEPLSITSLMVETPGAWRLEFSPLGTMDSPAASGTGSYITDIFTVTPPCMVSITFTHKGYNGLCSVILYPIYADGSIGYESVIDWGTRVSGTQSFDVIIKPEPNVVAYFWDVSCYEGIEWKIEVK